MNSAEKQAVLDYVQSKDPDGELIRRMVPDVDYRGGVIEYNPAAVRLVRAITQLNDEEYVRAYLFVFLVRELGYRPGPEIFEFEQEYSIGRPGKRQKGARVDIVLRYPPDWPDVDSRGRAFLFIECKAPEKYESDRQYLRGQLFDLARQEIPTPVFGVYYTVNVGAAGVILDRASIIDLTAFPTFQKWDDDGQPATDLIPAQYGIPGRIVYANIDEPSATQRPLRQDVGRAEFERLRSDLHNIVWGGGGTNNNDVFVILVRLFLCRIYDELETNVGEAYRFQRLARTDGSLESPDELVERMSALFKEAATAYLGYSAVEIDETTPFERKKVSSSKLAFVVEQIQDVSLTRNSSRSEGDLLGEFFEGIVSQDFTQSKGQFFTHVNIVKFCLDLLGMGDVARLMFTKQRDEQGRPRLPYIIDPSAGSGTFIVEAMKAVTAAIVPLLAGKLTQRQREFAVAHFGPDSPNLWAREFVYGIEPNADLGLATKVNMILHGDGSTNTFVTSGLLPFSEYQSATRNHVLAASSRVEAHPYSKPLNERFDFVVTNPPFSVSLSEEEKRSLGSNFELAAAARSETLFVERWYQLLREGGKFAAVLPESVLDTSTALSFRLYLLRYFHVEAIVSLPYVAFKPFTSTKTCVVMARKKTAAEVKAWSDAWGLAEKVLRQSVRKLSTDDEVKVRAACAAILWEHPAELFENGDLAQIVELASEAAKDESHWVFRSVLRDASFDAPIFMAEPQHVGYKRRKGLEDLRRPNDLVGDEDPSASDENEGSDPDDSEARDAETATPESGDADAAASDGDASPSVLAAFRLGVGASESSRFGFWVRLSDAGARAGLRLDPKFHVLWSLKQGRVFEGYEGTTVRVGDLLVAATRAKVLKGPLEDQRGLVELEDVEARTGRLLNVTQVEEVGSDKIVFGESEIAISKLEPYLGKVFINNPSAAWIGSTEWLTYKTASEDVEVDYVKHLLLLPSMLEAYRCLQSGKRHARFNERDFLDLQVPRLSAGEIAALAQKARRGEEIIERLRRRMARATASIGQLYVDEFARHASGGTN